MLDPLPPEAIVGEQRDANVDVIQLFVADRKELEARLPEVKVRLRPEAVLWVSDHKGTSPVPTDIKWDTILAYARSTGPGR